MGSSSFCGRSALPGWQPPRQPASRTCRPSVSLSVATASVSGGIDLTKTIRYRHLRENPQAAIVIDDLVSVDPWRPRGVKVRGPATLEDDEGRMRIRIRPQVVWSWGINAGTEKRFASVERRTVS